MIIVKLQGGLGNQMFQYSAGRSLSVKLGVPLKLDISYYQVDKKRQYKLGYFNIKADIATTEEIKKSKKGNIFMRLKKTLWKRNYEKKLFDQSYCFDEEIFDTKDGSYIEGFWQNENYFRNIENEIRNDFTLKESIPKSFDFILNQIENSNSVSIAIRRGDYIEPKYKKIFKECTWQYYQKAISIIDSRLDNPLFFVFSDDIDYAKNLKFPDKTVFIEPSLGLSDYHELILMSRCKHNIIANSTFSWWAGWLNQFSKKIVVTPKRWSIDDNKNEEDLLPKEWIKI